MAVWAPGDVVLGYRGTRLLLRVYTAAGALKDTVDLGPPIGPAYVCGMAFNRDVTKLYVTTFDQGQVLVVDAVDTAHPVLPPPWAIPATIGPSLQPISLPESVQVATDRTVFVGVGQSAGSFLLHYSPDGALLATLHPDADETTLADAGVDWIALHPNGTTFFYTNEGRRIKVYDVEAGQLPDLVTFPNVAGTKLFGIGRLDDGGCVVSCEGFLARVSSAGAITWSTTLDPSGDWFALDVDLDRVSFWASTVGLVAPPAKFAKYRVSDGALVAGPFFPGGDSGDAAGDFAICGILVVPVPVDTSVEPAGDDLGTACAGLSTKVCNQALARIGVTDPIVDIAAEATVAATIARLEFADCVAEVLRAFPWPFATRYADLNLVAGTADTAVNADWQYSYREPADSLFARRIVNTGGQRRGFDPTPPKFRMGTDSDGRLIYTSEVDPTLEYTYRPACAVSQGDALFRSALMWLVAAKFAPALARNKVTAGDCFAMFLSHIEKAKVAAANEGQPDKNDGDAEWIAGRS